MRHAPGVATWGAVGSRHPQYEYMGGRCRWRDMDGRARSTAARLAEEMLRRRSRGDQRGLRARFSRSRSSSTSGRAWIGARGPWEVAEGGYRLKGWGSDKACWRQCKVSRQLLGRRTCDLRTLYVDEAWIGGGPDTTEPSRSCLGGDLRGSGPGSRSERGHRKCHSGSRS